MKPRTANDRQYERPEKNIVLNKINRLVALRDYVIFI